MPIVKIGDQRIKFPDDMPQEEIAAVLAKQFPKETASAAPGDAQANTGADAPDEGGSPDTGAATEETVGPGGSFDPIGKLMESATGRRTLENAALREGASDTRAVDERVKELEAIPELFTVRVGGKHQTNAGRQFLANIGYLGLEGDDKVLDDLRTRIEQVSKAAGSLNDPDKLQAVIDAGMSPYNVETERMGDAILMNFDDPLTGERHVAWANKPGFSGRDAVSLMEGAAEIGVAMLGTGGVLGGTRLAREFFKRRGRQLQRDAAGRFTSRNSRKAARRAAREEKKAAKREARSEGGERKQRGTMAELGLTALEETAFRVGGIPYSAAVHKLATGKTVTDSIRGGVRGFVRGRSKLKRMRREVKRTP